MGFRSVDILVLCSLVAFLFCQQSHCDLVALGQNNTEYWHLILVDETTGNTEHLLQLSLTSFVGIDQDRSTQQLFLVSTDGALQIVDTEDWTSVGVWNITSHPNDLIIAMAYDPSLNQLITIQTRQPSNDSGVLPYQVIATNPDTQENEFLWTLDTVYFDQGLSAGYNVLNQTWVILPDAANTLLVLNIPASSAATVNTNAGYISTINYVTEYEGYFGISTITAVDLVFAQFDLQTGDSKVFFALDLPESASVYPNGMSAMDNSQNICYFVAMLESGATVLSSVNLPTMTQGEVVEVAQDYTGFEYLIVV